MDILEVKKLTKIYKYAQIHVKALDNFHLNAKEGEIIGIFGRSGSGKTTFLNIIGCLDRDYIGTVTICGKDISQIPTPNLPAFRRKNIGFVFQHYNLIPHLTLLENIELPMKYNGVSAKERRERATFLLKKVGLEHRKDFTPMHISGGEVQRASFVRAIANSPKIVLADEPTAQLDTQTSLKILNLIEEINRKHNITFIIATHDESIKNICHKIVYISDGKVREEKNI